MHVSCTNFDSIIALLNQKQNRESISLQTYVHKPQSLLLSYILAPRHSAEWNSAWRHSALMILNTTSWAYSAVTLRVNNFECYYTECHYASCCIFIVMLCADTQYNDILHKRHSASSIVMLIVIMLHVVFYMSCWVSLFWMSLYWESVSFTRTMTRIRFLLFVLLMKKVNVIKLFYS